jgi:hypothetical protein
LIDFVFLKYFIAEQHNCVMLGWCVVAEHLVICVLPNLGIGVHTLAAVFDGVWRHPDSLRPISSGVLVFNTLGWIFWFNVLKRHLAIR